MAGWKGMKSFHVLEVPFQVEFQGFDGTVSFVVQEVPQGEFVVRLCPDSGTSIRVLKQADCWMLRAHQSSRDQHWLSEHKVRPDPCTDTSSNT